jgi:hypothetical protein
MPGVTKENREELILGKVIFASNFEPEISGMCSGNAGKLRLRER